MVRDANSSDLPVIEAIHQASGADYRLPDLNSPLIVAKKVSVGANGVVGTCFLRLTAETYLILDPNLDPKEKFASIEELQSEILLEAYRLGLDDLNARIPPEITKRFTKRLIQLGWQIGRPDWSAWSISCETQPHKP